MRYQMSKSMNIGQFSVEIYVPYWLTYILTPLGFTDIWVLTWSMPSMAYVLALENVHS